MKQRNINVALECYVKKDGKYLMLHRSPDKKILPNVWMAPGGKREFNEGLFECARREIFEETGLKIKNLRIKATGNGYLKDINQEMFFHFIVADWVSGELKPEPGVGELAWFTPEEIFKLDNLLSELTEILPHVFSNDNKVISYKANYENGNEMYYFELEDPA